MSSDEWESHNFSENSEILRPRDRKLQEKIKRRLPIEEDDYDNE